MSAEMLPNEELPSPSDCPRCSEKTRAETMKTLAESRKLDAESEEILRRAANWRVESLARPVITAVIAAVIAGVAAWQFTLDATLRVNELNSIERAAIVRDQKRVNLELAGATSQYSQATQKLSEAERSLEIVANERDTLRLLFAQYQARAETKEAKALAEPAVRHLAEDQQSSSSASQSTQPWYAVVASTYSGEDARRITRDFQARQHVYQVEVFRATDGKGTPLYAVTLEGQISKKDALRIVDEAKSQGLASDAFAWTTPRWRKVDIASTQ